MSGSRPHGAGTPVPAETPKLVPSGFFALRTPLLPLAELIDWSEGLQAPAAVHDPERLDDALAADRAVLRARLAAVVARPEVRDALFVASPGLEESIDLWMQNPDSERGQEVERAVVRYFARMAGRPTPFGLFAGCSVGTLGPVTRLALDGRASYRRHTRLDMDYLFALAEALGRDASLAPSLRYRPSSSLYHVTGRARYVEARLDGTARSYHLVSVEDTDSLQAALARAADGATRAELAAALADDEVSLEEADAYVGELIASQILVPELALPVTGPSPIDVLEAELRGHPDGAALADPLASAREELRAMDRAGLGVEPGRYRALARRLEGLPAKVELPRLFQVDLIKPPSGAVLGADVLDEIVQGLEILRRLARPLRQDRLARFREAFVARYETREVRLVEALDEEAGIGFAPAEAASAEASPLLAGLAFPGEPEATAAWSDRESFLLRRLGDALASGQAELVLAPEDLEAIATKDPPPLPCAFEVGVTVVAASEQALADGRFRLLLHNVSGPSGARLLGRFCYADPVLHEQVGRHLRAEEALDPEAVFAEIVHLPAGRLGNILFRPVLRDYEIPYLGRSGAPLNRQLPITDLLVSVVGQQIVLRSERLRRRVVPRLTSAHNYSMGSLGLYGFLCALQAQGAAEGAAWTWGVLAGAPFLPRMSAGRLVLARAQWHASKPELRRLAGARGTARFAEVQRWRAERRLPRRVLLAEGDNRLPVDLDNALSVESFVHMVKGLDEATLVEMFPGPDELCAAGPEGRFVHELIVPFVSTPEAAPASPAAAARATPAPAPASLVRRRFPPGSEWLYAKLYTGTATADRVLCDVVGPVMRDALASGAADGWFFVRYGDPDWHLRWRIHGDPKALHEAVLPAVQAAVAPLLEDGRVWRITLDTYEREVERYGGPEGIGLAERLFHADSEAVLEIVELLEGDAGTDARWRLALRGMDMLLGDLGFDLATRCAVLTRAREAFFREFRADRALKRQVSEKYRPERKALESLLDPAQDEGSWLAPGFEALTRRSARLAPVGAELRALEQAGRVASPLAELAPSYLHMHANRLLRAAQRAHELVLYDFLTRYYSARLHRNLPEA